MPYNQEKNNRSWGVNFLWHTTIAEENTAVRVESGLEFILGHFSEPLFPRSIMRGGRRGGQFDVDSKDTTMSEYQPALWEDCRINAFSVDQRNPDLIFIDLDAQNFATMRTFKLALSATLGNIEKKIGGHPTVIWSGCGYHIIQPIDCPLPLEDNNKELEALEPEETSKAFLQFAPRYLSAGKSDRSHNPSLRSCLLRVPGSINSKNRSEVRVLQRWDGNRPDYRPLLGAFHIHLVDDRLEKQKKSEWENRNYCNSSSVSSSNDNDDNGTPVIEWIEKLLQTGVEDNRKGLMFWVVSPYLITVRGLDYDEASTIIVTWLAKCDQVRRLQPDRNAFKHRLKHCLQVAYGEKRRPMGLQKFGACFPDVYKQLQLQQQQ